MRQLAPGHYVLIAGRFNSGVIATNEGAAVVDAIAPEEVARQQRELIANELRQPVKYLVSSTFHDNYSKGNISFHDVVKIGTERYRTDLLALMQRGNVSSEEQKARTPTQTFRDKMTVYLGGKELQILYLGRGHTAGDSIVFVPQDRIAYLSELYFHEEFPFMADGYGIAWIETLGKIEALEADIFVPAHGIIPANPRETRAGLRRARQRLIAVRDAVQQQVARGATEEQAVAAIQFPEYEGLRGYPQQKDIAVRRIYQEIKGTLR
jgi:glyoxylase-like metal-dependent hydrolase (beta-lactamase superfamily II)